MRFFFERTRIFIRGRKPNHFVKSTATGCARDGVPKRKVTGRCIWPPNLRPVPSQKRKSSTPRGMVGWLQRARKAKCIGRVHRRDSWRGALFHHNLQKQHALRSCWPETLGSTEMESPERVGYRLFKHRQRRRGLWQPKITTGLFNYM